MTAWRLVATLALALLAGGDGTAHLDVHEIIRQRWGDWVGNRESIGWQDLDHAAAQGSLEPDDTAACAALIQTLHFMERKQATPTMRREDLLKGSNAVADRMLTRSFSACLRKLQQIPTQLWADGAPHEEAVSQAGDRSGDCWLLAPTGWMVRHRPEVVKAAIEPIEGGRYRVTFPSRATVEVSRPTDVEIISVNGDLTLKDGLWLPVLKEAMGTVLGERNPKKARIESESLRVNGGSMPRMMEHWTGHRTRSVPLEGKMPVDELRSAIAEALARKAMVGFGSGKEPAGKIPPNHAYAVLGLDAEHGTLRVWNPWNNDFTPKGESGRENGYARKDGVAEIPLADSAQIFRMLFIETDEPFDARVPSPKEAAARARKAADANAGAKP